MGEERRESNEHDGEVGVGRGFFLGPGYCVYMISIFWRMKVRSLVTAAKYNYFLLVGKGMRRSRWDLAE